MKNFFKSAAITVALGLCFAPSAFGDCISGCVNSPSASTTQTFQVGGSANFGGNGRAVFKSDHDGFSRVEKNGYGRIDVEVDAAGNLCGNNCQTGKFKFSGSAGEHVKASAGALSIHSGVPAIAENKGTAFGNVTFGVKKTLNK